MLFWNEYFSYVIWVVNTKYKCNTFENFWFYEKNSLWTHFHWRWKCIVFCKMTVILIILQHCPKSHFPAVPRLLLHDSEVNSCFVYLSITNFLFSLSTGRHGLSRHWCYRWASGPGCRRIWKSSLLPGEHCR